MHRSMRPTRTTKTIGHMSCVSTFFLVQQYPTSAQRMKKNESRRYGLSPFRLCRRFGLFKMNVAVMVCRRFGSVAVLTVAVSVCRRFDCTPTLHHSLGLYNRGRADARPLNIFLGPKEASRPPTLYQ